jgi:hypothetical protein
MGVGFVAAPALLVGVIGLVRCGSAAKPYTVSATAGCGVYRLLASVRGRFDNTRIRIRRGSLVMYDGLIRDPRTLNQIHCCWTTWLRATTRWRGTELVSTVRKRVRPLPRPLLNSRY